MAARYIPHGISLVKGIFQTPSRQLIVLFILPLRRVLLSISDSRSPISSISIPANYSHLPNRIHFTTAPYPAVRKSSNPISFSIAKMLFIEADTVVEF